MKRKSGIGILITGLTCLLPSWSLYLQTTPSGSLLVSDVVLVPGTVHLCAVALNSAPVPLLGSSITCAIPQNVWEVASYFTVSRPGPSHINWVIPQILSNKPVLVFPDIGENSQANLLMIKSLLKDSPFWFQSKGNPESWAKQGQKFDFT